MDKCLQTLGTCPNEEGSTFDLPGVQSVLSGWLIEVPGEPRSTSRKSLGIPGFRGFFVLTWRAYLSEPHKLAAKDARPRGGWDGRRHEKGVGSAIIHRREPCSPSGALLGSATMSLSTKPIPREERLIVALDVPTRAEAETLVGHLGDSVRFYKIGLELLMSGGYFDVLKSLVDQGKRVFADIKMYDVPQTVSAAVRGLADKGATFATVHGNDDIMTAACEAKGSLKILAVTVLTSLDQRDIEGMGYKCTVEDLVLHRAGKALEIGCDGVISSPNEAPQIRAKFGDKLLIVAPGIRHEAGRPDDDQKRTANAEMAFRNGADYIVVGRPIRQARSPKAAAEDIQRAIASVFLA